MKTNALATSGNNHTVNQRNSSQVQSQDHTKAEVINVEENSPNAPAPSLEIIERTRYGRDRAGIIFSNALSQVRQRMIPHDQIKCGVDFNGYSEYQNGQLIQQPDQKRSFFKTATNEINYRHILGFDLKDQEEFEAELIQQVPYVQEYNRNDDSNRVPPMQKYQELMDNSNAIGFA